MNRRSPQQVAFTIIATFSILGGCKDQHKETRNAPAANTGKEEQEIIDLRHKLSTDESGIPFNALLRKGSAGFDAVIDALSNGEVRADLYLEWSFDLQTRHDDGKALFERFETRLFVKAEKDNELSENLASNFFSNFPPETLEVLKADPRPGAKRIAEDALLKPQKRQPPSSRPH